ncbi:hypothetical protein AB0F81_38100 [Actinoplanes sp. NPDC024001]|uniref:hypothetical protein n=1 Tax=Actinoplanes sp. NPDC024001 TaxID=3154598 RepID=UPI0033D9AB35
MTTQVRTADHSVGDFYRLGEFTAYPDAANLLHRLYEGGFPVLRARILDLHPSRGERSDWLLAGRAALIGAGLGAWLGLLAGLVLLLVLPGLAWLDVVLGALLIGAAAGGVLGLIIHEGTDARRDRGEPAADRYRYAVEVETAYIADAARALGDRAARTPTQLPTGR